ncbi:MAG TPA: hypothetical protein GX702_14210 [Chloroflexi bacterium]|jgi:hypothetical protein|nr:hypothetical protein [Chloroflexota bacterium]
MNRRRRLAREDGITLLEMLIATAIGTVVLSVVVMALYQFGGLSRLHQDTLTLSQQTQSVSTLLNRDVAGAMSGLVDEEGQRLTLEIPGYPFGQVVPAEIRQVVYRYDPDARVLLRDDGDGAWVIGRQIEAIDFGEDGPVGDTLIVEMTTLLPGQSRTLTLSFNRRLTAQ